MRYSDRGGLSALARSQREALRLEAAGLFAAGVSSGEIARRLRVTRKSVNAWRRAWKAGGTAALASRGPGGAACRLDETQLKVLETELDVGPAVHGWAEDQRWTLARVSALIWELFRVRYTVRGTSYLLHRIGWSPQVPVHRAAERDEGAVATWVKETWPQVKRRRRAWVRGSASLMSLASR
jgi:transposase